MYAIIATGGKQYKVAEGDIIRVEMCIRDRCGNVIWMKFFHGILSMPALQKHF